jgi:hypothetical protein
MMRVVTNNPTVLERMAQAEFVPGPPAEVLGRVEALLCGGYRLAGPPVAGNLVMLRSPYRSVLLEEAPGGIVPAGDCMKVADARGRALEREGWTVPEQTRTDYALMDSMFLDRAIEECGPALPGWK